MMDKLKYRLLLFAVLAGISVACDKVHQFPTPGQEVDPTEVKTSIRIKCKVRLDGSDIFVKSGEPVDLKQDVASLYDRRLLVSIQDNEYTDSLVESHIITRDVIDTSDFVIETSLHTKKYKVVMWMDYVRKGTEEDLYYLTDNGASLDAIHQLDADKYVAGSEFKDAQTFVSDIDLTPYANQWYAEITIPASMTRPVAKITILADDMAEYAASIGFAGTLEDFADQIAVDVRYDGYYPTGFNAFTGRLNDSQSGYGYKSLATYPYVMSGKDYSRVGFDYVFVNGESSSITLSVRIKWKNGNIINEINNVAVPVTRGKETVVISKFFTKEYVPGIGINPGYDGEYDVYM